MFPIRNSFFGTVFLSLLITGCADDPSNLGIGLVDIQAGEPQSIVLEPTGFELDDDADFTGGYQSFDLSQGTTVLVGPSRVLSGRVDDPDLGLVSADANLDFVPSVSVGDVFRDGTVSSVTLILVTDYAYGDTLSPVTFRLSEIESDWNAIGVKADTVISAGPTILEQTFDPSEEGIAINFPQSWVDQNDARLRSESLADVFHGFQITSVNGNVILGFNRRVSLLEIAVPGDTLKMGVDRIVTSITKDALPTPAEFVLLQDGLDVASVTLDFGREDFVDSSVHNAVFRVDAATPALSLPAGFVRPSISTLDLVAITGAEESRVLLSTVTIDDNGQFSFSNNDLVLAIQNTARGIGDLVRFELAAPIVDHTLNYLFLEKMSVNGGPRMLLTITEVN